jgi:DNA-binding transcriptional regulator/RsmH inhibitor MraZ
MDAGAGNGPTQLERAVFADGHEDFSGRHPRTLDDKFRVVLPAGNWRDHFADGGKLTFWIDCLALWTPRSFRVVTADLLSQERMGVVPEGTYGDLLEDTVDVTPDGQGRIGLPGDLRHDVGIGDKGAEVLLVGKGDRIEIWDKGRREADRATRPREAAARALRSFKY